MRLWCYGRWNGGKLALDTPLVERKATGYDDMLLFKNFRGGWKGRGS